MNLRQVAVPLEDPITHATLLVDVHGRCVLLAASHGALHAFINLDLDGGILVKHIVKTFKGAFEGNRVVVGVRHTLWQRDAFSVFDDDDLNRMIVNGQLVVDGHLVFDGHIVVEVILKVWAARPAAVSAEAHGGGDMAEEKLT